MKSRSSAHRFPVRSAENRAEDRTLPGVHSTLASVTPPHLTCESPRRKTPGAMLRTAWQLPNILITNNSKGFFFGHPAQLAAS